MKDILGQALHDYYYDNKPADLWIHNQYGPKEDMPVDIFFRDDTDMPDLELTALKLCRGRVLDIGAGAGSHALYLQQNGLEVKAIDISGLAVSIIKARGVSNALETDIFTFSGEKFDTLLMLMNGIGLAGTLENLRNFLAHAKTLLKVGGQLLFDSSDIAYLYEDATLPINKYYGELWYQYEYKDQRNDWFNWLYIDKNTLSSLAKEEGWLAEILFEDEYDQYLVRLTVI